MRDKSKKIYYENSGIIVEKWIRIIVFTYLISWAIISLLGYLFIKLNVYGEYYKIFTFYLINLPGIPLLLIGLIINELTYFLKNKSYKRVVCLIISALCIFGISYKLIKYSGSYRCYKDLHYVINNTYCEVNRKDEQEQEQEQLETSTSNVPEVNSLQISEDSYDYPADHSKGFWEEMEAITGLAGATLVAYVIISEGSRLFPPRNLIPVP
ncbi:hypothetical protein [Clostridium sp. ZBS2]|uniref:hypothetical protein n=1 Tax=Clostridium sp. ZBS2 TaxID=2949976 RepID=UPI00207AEF12|nr:hypothetical protein [Clostridium sp. ZBS2]